MKKNRIQNRKAWTGILPGLLLAAVLCLACGCGKAKVDNTSNADDDSVCAEEISKEAISHESCRPEILESSAEKDTKKPRPPKEADGSSRITEVESSKTSEPAREERQVDTEGESSQQDLSAPPAQEASWPEKSLPAVSSPDIASDPKPSEVSSAAPAPHQHSWQPIYLTVHHDAVTQELWVVDVPAHQEEEEVKEWHKQCDGCGAILDGMSQEEVDQHMMEHMDKGEPSSYGDRLVAMGRRLVDVAEVGHTETRVVREAYDSIAFGGLVCTECGQKRGPDQVPDWRDYMPEGWTEN